ncbi:MAG: tyrosine-type recombinase/integrase [Pseudomonadota bacterium]
MGRHKTKHKHLPPKMQLKKGRYYWVGYKDGKRPYIPLGNDYLAALVQYRDIEGIGNDTQTVAKLLTWYLSRCGKLSAATMVEYNRSAAVLKKEFEGFTLPEVRPKHIAQFMQVVFNGTVAGARHIAFLSAAWNACRSAGLTDLANPCTGVKKPRTGKRKRVATDHERAEVLKGPGPIPLMAELDLLIGARQHDIRLMKLSQITDAGIEVEPSKTKNSTGKKMLFVWTPALRACVAKAKLLRRKPSSEYLFPTRTGEPYTKDGFQTMWKKHLKAQKITGLTYNDLRRTAINDIEEQGGAYSAQGFAGHASIKTTEIYLTNNKREKINPTK